MSENRKRSIARNPFRVFPTASRYPSPGACFHLAFSQARSPRVVIIWLPATSFHIARPGSIASSMLAVVSDALNAASAIPIGLLSPFCSSAGAPWQPAARPYLVPH